MDLQKKLDFMEQYRTALKFLPRPSQGIEYMIVPGPKIEHGPAEVSHGRKETSKR